MRSSRSFALYPILGLALCGVAQAGPAVVLEGARLIDGTGAPPRDNVALVIEGDKITAVGIAGKLARPKGARVVDLRGRTRRRFRSLRRSLMRSRWSSVRPIDRLAACMSNDRQRLHGK